MIEKNFKKEVIIKAILKLTLISKVWNISPNSQPSSISQMNPPAYPNLTDIYTTIKGTVEELL